MGVHTTFVRSVDLDEWTQRQIDAMRLGGNANAQQFFRKHGFTDFHAKVDKKYKSKAAQAYKVELQKLVEAEAAKRGEDVSTDDAATTSNLLDNLNLAGQKEADAEARAKLEAARRASSGPIQAKNVKASQNPNAKGRLATPPSSGNGPKIVLRKP